MLVSIIMPVYNAEEYLAEAVQSLVNQSYRDIEILLVNDGSTDSSPEICDNFANVDPRVRVFHKENGGTHTARNLGIEESRGDFLMFIDPDDWFDTDTVEQLVSAIEKDSLDVVRFNYVREFRDHSLVKPNTLLSEEVMAGEGCKKVCRQAIGLIGEELRNPESMNFLASVCFAAYKKSIITDNDIRFVNIREIATFSDGLFNINFLMFADRFRFIDKAFYHYRKYNTASATSNYRPDFLKRQSIMFDKLSNMVNMLDRSDCYEAFNNRICHSTMEMCLNAFKAKHSLGKKYREIKEILSDSLHKEAGKTLTLGYFPLKWRVYFFFIKHRMTLFVFLMTAVIRIIQKRG